MNYAFCLKFFFAISIGVTVISNVHTEVTSETFEVLISYTIDGCRVRENASDEDVAAIMSLDGDWPDTREGKCFIDCFLEEVGLVRTSFVLRGLKVFKTLFFSSKTTSFTSEDFSPSLSCCSRKLQVTTATRCSR